MRFCECAIKGMIYVEPMKIYISFITAEFSKKLASTLIAFTI